MALDRQSIEKKDFPIGRRGYDPEAVDEHLAAVAAEVEKLRADSRRRTDTLASQASDQVRMIVQAAESSAAEITRQAESDARDIRQEAETEAQTVRERASEEARDYVARISESSSGMLQRVDAMESELGSLLENLRAGANRVNADLALLESNMTDLRDATSGASLRGGFEPEEATVEEPVAEPVAIEEPEEELAPAPLEPVEEELEPEPELEPEVATEAPAPSGGNDEDAEGARLVALNMALNGTPREETDRYLAEHYALSDRTSLLDEVYATVGE